MIDQTGVGVANVAVSAAFYDAALGALGLRRLAQMPEGEGTDGISYGVAYPIFWIDKFHPNSIRQHTDAFHRSALDAGGTDHGAPGDRKDQTTPTYYAAFVLDPDGNNIEAVFRGE